MENGIVLVGVTIKTVSWQKLIAINDHFSYDLCMTLVHTCSSQCRLMQGKLISWIPGGGIIDVNSSVSSVDSYSYSSVKHLMITSANFNCGLVFFMTDYLPFCGAIRCRDTGGNSNNTINRVRIWFYPHSGHPFIPYHIIFVLHHASYFRYRSFVALTNFELIAAFLLVLI